MKPAHELLYDSEASLRLVDRAIGDLSPAGVDADTSLPTLHQHLEQSTGAGGDPVDALLDDYANTAAIVVRFCQTAGMLDGNALRALRPTPRHLHAVSVRTAATTSAIVDGLARAVTLVDAIEGRQGLTDEGRREISASLREELNGLADHLQHQEITIQQLGEIETLFGDLRRKIVQVVSLFSPPAMSGAAFAADGSIDRESSRTLADAPYYSH